MNPTTPEQTPPADKADDDVLRSLEIRIHGPAGLPTLIYLPGIHGDWTLVTDFRAAVKGRIRFVEFSYPRTLTWSLDDYAAAVEAALISSQITSGWLLGESFGSQVVWALLARAQSRGETSRLKTSEGTPPETVQAPRFHAEGVVLAGGFGRHPINWGVRLARRFVLRAPLGFQRACFRLFAIYARQRHRRTPETVANVMEFVRRRLDPLDQRAIAARLGLIAEFDPASVARNTRVQVYSLAGLVDPIVPLPWVRTWLKRHCPGYRGGMTILLADHNVLGTAPQASARAIEAWMRAGPAQASF